MGVSKNRPKSSILIGFSIINLPFSGTPIFGNTHMFFSFFPSVHGTWKITMNLELLHHAGMDAMRFTGCHRAKKSRRSMGLAYFYKSFILALAKISKYK